MTPTRVFDCDVDHHLDDHQVRDLHLHLSVATPADTEPIRPGMALIRARHTGPGGRAPLQSSEPPICPAGEVPVALDCANADRLWQESVA